MVINTRPLEIYQIGRITKLEIEGQAVRRKVVWDVKPGTINAFKIARRTPRTVTSTMPKERSEQQRGCLSPV